MLSATELDPKVRFLVLYQDADWTAKRIADVLKISLRTAQDWILKIHQDIDIGIVRPGRGRKLKIPEATKKKIVRTVQRRPAGSTVCRLAATYQVGIGSAYSVLEEKGLIYRSVIRQPILSEYKKKQRRIYCKEMLRRKGKLMKETFFSDETGIKLSNINPKKAWRLPYKQVKLKTPAKDISRSIAGEQSSKKVQHLFISTKKAWIVTSIKKSSSSTFLKWRNYILRDFLCNTTIFLHIPLQ